MCVFSAIGFIMLVLAVGVGQVYVAGNIQKRSPFGSWTITVIGPTVNFASRLEGKAEGDQIMISRETKEKTEGIFTFNEKVVNIQSWGETKVYIVAGKISVDEVA